MTPVLALAAAALAVSQPVIQPSRYSDAVPPIRYQRGATAVLEIAQQPQINRTCHTAFGAPPAGMKTDACTTSGRIIMPNPCLKADTESYARLLCHELAHINGWPPSHGD